MCCLLVSGFFTEMTQQIHSLRASGVISSHFARAARSEIRAFRKSAGTACTGPREIVFFAMNFVPHRHTIAPAPVPSLHRVTPAQRPAFHTRDGRV